MSMYEFLLAVHILCAVLWVGGGSTLHVLGRRAQKQGGAAMLHFTDEASWIGPRFYAPLSVVLLIAGVFLVSKAGFDQSELFVTVGYLGWIVSFAIGIGVYPRIEQGLQAAAESDGVDSPAFGAAFSRYASVNSVELTILVLVVIDMSIKPGI